jgi:hypothetical protein
MTMTTTSARTGQPAARIIRLLALLLLGPCLMGAERVKDYRPFRGLARPRRGHGNLIVLRSFVQGRERRCLVLDPSSLVTSLRDAADLEIEAAAQGAIEKRLGATPYFEALKDATANAAALQNAGLTRLLASPPGVALTVDLCPSRNPMDRQLFTEIVREFGKKERPVPVAVAVTGVWMEEHPADLEFLKKLERSGDVSITWINHSYHHRWDKALPLKHNFLLEQGTDVAAEVLRTEAAMIERGLTPSVFFRFPGLVSDRELLLTVESFGLVPVGSDAWLGKNQWPREGSIVLVHANGNEPIGVTRFLKLLREERGKIVRREWLLLDLREATVVQERKREAR